MGPARSSARGSAIQMGALQQRGANWLVLVLDSNFNLGRSGPLSFCLPPHSLPFQRQGPTLEPFHWLPGNKALPL